VTRIDELLPTARGAKKTIWRRFGNANAAITAAPLSRFPTASATASDHPRNPADAGRNEKGQLKAIRQDGAGEV
jgi:hypothetical protein